MIKLRYMVPSTSGMELGELLTRLAFEARPSFTERHFHKHHGVEFDTTHFSSFMLTRSDCPPMRYDPYSTIPTPSDYLRQSPLIYFLSS
jgi:hypothetical protein